MDWLMLSFFLTFGWVPNQSDFGMAPNGPGQINVFEQTLGLRADILRHAYVATELETRDVCDDVTSWRPYQARYRIAFGVYAKNVELTLKHECIHPVLSDFGRDVASQTLTDETEIAITLRSKR